MAGPDDVAVDLDGDVVICFAGVCLEKIDRPLPRPALGVNTGINDQADGPPHFVGQLAELGIRVGVKAHLLAEALGIQAPALDVAGVAAVLAELRQAHDLVGDGQLQMMPRHSLVQRERLHLPLGTRLQVVGVGKEKTGAAGVVRSGLIIGSCDRLLDVRRNRNYAVRLAWQFAKQLGQLGVGPLADVSITGEQLVGCLVVKPRISPEELEERVQVTLEANLFANRLHLASDTLHFAQTDVVNLIRAERRGGVMFDLVIVPRPAVGQRATANGRAAIRHVLVTQERVQPLERRADLVGINRLGRLGQARLLRRRNGVRKLFELGKHRRGHGADVHLPGHLIRHGSQRHFRRHDPARQSFLKQRDGLIDQCRNAAQARQDILVILCPDTRHHGDHRRHITRQTVHLVEHEELGRKLLTLDRHLGVAAKQVVIQLVGFTELGPIKRKYGIERQPGIFLAHGEGIHGQVAPAIILPGVPSPCRRFRRGDHPVLPVHVKKLPESLSAIRLPLGRDDVGAFFAVALAVIDRMAKRYGGCQQNDECDGTNHCGTIVPLGQARGNSFGSGKALLIASKKTGNSSAVGAFSRRQ